MFSYNSYPSRFPVHHLMTVMKKSFSSISDLCMSNYTSDLPGFAYYVWMLCFFWMLDGMQYLNRLKTLIFTVKLCKTQLRSENNDSFSFNAL